MEYRNTPTNGKGRSMTISHASVAGTGRRLITTCRQSTTRSSASERMRAPKIVIRPPSSPRVHPRPHRQDRRVAHVVLDPLRVDLGLPGRHADGLQKAEDRFMAR